VFWTVSLPISLQSSRDSSAGLPVFEEDCAGGPCTQLWTHVAVQVHEEFCVVLVSIWVSDLAPHIWRWPASSMFLPSTPPLFVRRVDKRRQSVGVKTHCFFPVLSSLLFLCSIAGRGLCVSCRGDLACGWMSSIDRCFPSGFGWKDRKCEFSCVVGGRYCWIGAVCVSIAGNAWKEKSFGFLSTIDWSLFELFLFLRRGWRAIINLLFFGLVEDHFFEDGVQSDLMILPWRATFKLRSSTGRP